VLGLIEHASCTLIKVEDFERERSAAGMGPS
jgi:hypothetical protein